MRAVIANVAAMGNIMQKLANKALSGWVANSHSRMSGRMGKTNLWVSIGAMLGAVPFDVGAVPAERADVPELAAATGATMLVVVAAGKLKGTTGGLMGRRGWVMG